MKFALFIVKAIAQYKYHKKKNPISDVRSKSSTYKRIRIHVKKILSFIFSIIQKVIITLKYILHIVVSYFQILLHKFAINLSKINYIQLLLAAYNIYLNNEGVIVKSAKLRRISKYSVLSCVYDSSTIHKVCIPEFYNHTNQKIIDVTKNEASIMQINNIRVIGESNVITTNDDRYLLNEIYFDTNKRADLRYGALFGLYNSQAYFYVSNNSISVDNGIYLLNPGNYNLYHLVFETLSRLIQIDTIKEYKEYPLLVDECVRNNPNLYDYFNRVNSGHKVIWIKKNQSVFVSHLVIATGSEWMPGNIRYGKSIQVNDFAVSEKTIWDLRNKMMGEGLKPSSYKKIFISRKNMKSSRLINERIVSQQFAAAGFKIIQPEKYTVRQQISLFMGADCLVGSSGGAFTNILFCKPGTVVSCIVPEEHQFYMYSTIAHSLQLNPVFLKGQIKEKTEYPSNDKYSVDEEDINDFIDYINNIRTFPAPTDETMECLM